MFWYKCPIIRESKMPGLKPIANDILFTSSAVCSGSVIDLGYV